MPEEGSLLVVRLPPFLLDRMAASLYRYTHTFFLWA
jgi:hypothetical protein